MLDFLNLAVCINKGFVWIQGTRDLYTLGVLRCAMFFEYFVIASLGSHGAF